MRLIDADALLKKWIEQNNPELMTMEAYYAKMICQILTLIYDAPTIDAIEVVRCKDCKHRPFVPKGEIYENGLSIVGDEICPCICDDGWYSWIPADNHYCSYGERIER